MDFEGFCNKYIVLNAILRILIDNGSSLSPNVELYKYLAKTQPCANYITFGYVIMTPKASIQIFGCCLFYPW